MAGTSTRQLSLLADHLKLSLLERQRAISLRLDSGKQDAQISRALNQLQDGIESIESQQQDLGQAEESSSDLDRLRRQFAELYAQFHGSSVESARLSPPNHRDLEDDFAAARTRPLRTGSNKSVRFRDNPDATYATTAHNREYVDDPEDAANRAALFADQERYRDEPEGPDQSQMDNQQIHAYHKQVLQDQDDQLDVLGQSVGRQRVLGIQMGNELDEQVEILDDVERGVDRHTTGLDRARRRLGTVAKKSRDNWQWVTIGILICILVLLIVVLK